MQSFAYLLDRLILTPSRNSKLRLLVDYFRQIPDPDRGYAVAAITRDLDIKSVKPAMARALVEERVDPVLFGLSYDFVGDMAETISLIWPNKYQPSKYSADDHEIAEPLRLAVVVETLQSTTRAEGVKYLEGWLDQLDADGRWALLKLITGGLRIGVSSRLVKQALADFGAVDVSEIEELWHGLHVPYTELFAWLEGKSEKPVNVAKAPFRPVMLAHPLEEKEHSRITPEEYAVEWKWDGIRVQATNESGEVRLYSRTGDDISGAFPDVVAALDFEGSIDGELLVRQFSENANEVDEMGLIPASSFSDLQQRLNRKKVSKKLLASHPAFIRAYDLLQLGNENLRPLPFVERRKRLQALMKKLAQSETARGRIDLSPLVTFSNLQEIAHLRENPPHPVIEGLMLKQWNSIYQLGRPKGPWFKWKKDPHLVDCVLMYAQRGHGKRSSFYSDYTFGVWKSGEEGDILVPVGKAYSGFTDEELKKIDKFVRDNTIDRFGPVRSVKAAPEFGLVLEVAFEGLNRSTRHKSGVAMRFPRISRLRWDKPPHEADRLENLTALLS